MARTVVVVAPAGDAHAQTVARRVESLGGTAVLVDSAAFPTEWQLDVALDAEGTRYRLRNERAGVDVDGEDVAGVWWRRPRLYDPDERIEAERVRRFVALEAADAFEGWLQTLGSRVVNPVAADAAAHRKPYQLSVAAAVGLRVPETLVTNSPDAARTFAERTDPTVYKALSGPVWQAAETRRLDQAVLEQLDGVALAPVILQAEVRDKRDVRVVVVDDEVFAATVTPRRPEAELDWRLDRSADVEPYRLPDPVASGLRALLDALGLRFGAVDLAVTPEGEHVFLEVNPGGQWLFVEVATGQPISTALARALLRGGPPGTDESPAMSTPLPTRAFRAGSSRVRTVDAG